MSSHDQSNFCTVNVTSSFFFHAFLQTGCRVNTQVGPDSLAHSFYILSFRFQNLISHRSAFISPSGFFQILNYNLLHFEHGTHYSPGFYRVRVIQQPSQGIRYDLP
jgi:hypothetical protein